MQSFFYLPSFPWSLISLLCCISPSSVELIAKVLSPHVPLGDVSLRTRGKSGKKKNNQTISITAGMCCDTFTLQTQHSMKPFTTECPQTSSARFKRRGHPGKTIHFTKTFPSRDNNHINYCPPGPQHAWIWQRKIWKIKIKHTLCTPSYTAAQPSHHCKPIFTRWNSFQIQSPSQISE